MARKSLAAYAAASYIEKARPGSTFLGANGYVCFWRGKRWEVYAATSLEAHRLAVAYWHVSAKRAHEVAVVLAEKNGETVTHSTTEFG